MKPTSNRLLVEWLPVEKVGSIHLPYADYHNSDSVKMFKVVAAGPGRISRKGVLIPNEVQPGDNVILDARVSGRPEEIGNGRFLVKNPDEAVIAVVPKQSGAT